VLERYITWRSGCRPLGPELLVNESKYVLITPAKNEQLYIGETIRSVVAQTLRPIRWIIVDDGSTDQTARTVAEACTEYPFISLISQRGTEGRSFGSKVAAFNAGLEMLKDADFSFIGNLDADISLPPNYYQSVLAEFDLDPKLGIAGGTVFTNVGNRFASYDETADSVAGAVQLFRRECFEEVGGYPRLRRGGIDAVAEITARMHGWSVRKTLAVHAYEHRRTGSAQSGWFLRSFREGMKFHSLGYSPAFYFCRCAYRSTEPPFLMGSLLELIGFAWAKLRRHPIYLDSRVVSYLRNEQRSKLKYKLFGANSKPIHLPD
jgi:glycosyltransferase involved in cell wall biosynthesis